MFVNAGEASKLFFQKPEARLNPKRERDYAGGGGRKHDAECESGVAAVKLNNDNWEHRGRHSRLDN